MSARFAAAAIAALALLWLAAPASAAQPDLDLLQDVNVRIDGQGAGDQAGATVASAGDVNGDGRDDVIVSAPNDFDTDTGTVYVVFGSPTPTNVDLGNLGSAGFRVFGFDGSSGLSVAGAGDVNDDGLDDVVIGVPNESPLGRSGAGAAYVVYGSAAPSPGDLDVSAGASPRFFSIAGAAADDALGGAEQSGDVDESVDEAGDFNGDGVDDLIVGAGGADNRSRANSGSAYVVYGSGVADRADIDLAQLDSGGTLENDGRQIDGQAPDDGFQGTTVAGAGDVDGDGVDDVIIGAPAADNNSRNFSGSAYVVYGVNLADAGDVDLAGLGSNGFRIDGAGDVDALGWSLDGAGDVNDDELDDFVVGAPIADTNGVDSGSAYVVYGRARESGLVINLASLIGDRGFQIYGQESGDGAGWSVAGAGDVDGDGQDDIVTGAPLDDSHGRANNGAAYVVYGSAEPDPGDVSFHIPDASRWFLAAGPADNANTGKAVGGGGDFNADGRDDAIVGAPGAGGGSAFVVIRDGDLDGDRDDADNCWRTPNADQADADGDASAGGDLDGGDACDPNDDTDTILDASDNCRTVANEDQANNDAAAAGGDAEGDACDTDDDADTVADGSDNCHFVANADQVNTDGDTEGNVCDADDDNDALLDGPDNCPVDANADQADNDGTGGGDACDPNDDADTVLDATDNCRTIANEDQANNDGDANGDVCDADDDNDAVGDGADNCQFAANADQADLDGFGGGDACDPDDDNDQVPDGSDNCRTVQNAGQANNDGDSLGDACDPDDDNDSVDDAADNCRTVENPGQANSDGDSAGDVCDADDDNDGVRDVDDNCRTTANEGQDDADADGQGDACDPRDSTPPPPPGDETCTVPSIDRGSSVRETREALEDAGCTLGEIARASHRRVDRGGLIKLKTKAGTVLEAGTEIDAIFSKGRRK